MGNQLSPNYLKAYQLKTQNAKSIRHRRIMDLSRFLAAPSARFSRFPFECDKAIPAQCRVTATRIVKAIDVLEDGQSGFFAVSRKDAAGSVRP